MPLLSAEKAQALANALNSKKCAKYLVHPDYQKQLVWEGKLDKTTSGLTQKDLAVNPKTNKITTQRRIDAAKDMSKAAKQRFIATGSYFPTKSAMAASPIVVAPKARATRATRGKKGTSGGSPYWW